MHDILIARAALTAALTSTLAFGCDASESLPLPARLSGFSAPESVLHDLERDVYLVSNLGDGGPLGRDGDGFISRIDPEGALDLRFISSDRRGVRLDAPKGMAVLEGELFVADIDRLRIFDAESGAPLRELPIEGADMLNDVVLERDGTLYVSDLAVDASFMPTGNDAIYRVRRGGAPERWLSGSGLGNPNGLALTAEALWVVTYGSGELIEVALDGQIRARHAAPQGGLDGIVALDAERFLLTSWSAEAVFFATHGGVFETEREAVPSPADIGFDRLRGRLLLPLMGSGQVLIDAPQID